MLINHLKKRAEDGTPIRVGLVGAGCMGAGIVWQIARTPGMQVVWVADLSEETAAAAVRAAGLELAGSPSEIGPGRVLVGTDTDALLAAEAPELGIDVFVESTNTIGAAARYCLAAIDRGAHVILMNAEVDLAFGPLLCHRAAEKGVVVTSDAGDQHGVLMRMIGEIELWGFRIVQIGNVKGFLDRYQTAEGLREEAAKRNLSPIQCCAYTDGTKLCIEMAVIANATGAVPFVRGMEGPKAADVHEALSLFDFPRYPDEPVVDYVLGAEPGGGVYVVGFCDDPVQMPYLKYYKLGDGPYYLFYRPYHLCHLETTRAIAKAALFGEAVVQPWKGRVTDVYAFAKRDVAAGTAVEHGIGGDDFYGLIERASVGRGNNFVPVWLLDPDGEGRAIVRVDVAKDEPLTYDMVELPDNTLTRLLDEQRRTVPNG